MSGERDVSGGRRKFLKTVTGSAAGMVIASTGLKMTETSASAATAPIPQAEGYLIYDAKKCTGCHSCMFACSMVHEGKAQLSTSRIQITEDRLGTYPDDISVDVCRQCKDPACLEACPADAIVVDKDHFNARIVDEELCIADKSCIEACHFMPSRMRFNDEKEVAAKCDLCKNTPFWKHEKGKLACVEVCPVNTIKFTSKPPAGRGGYEVNLRGKGWAKLDLPVD